MRSTRNFCRWTTLFFCLSVVLLAARDGLAAEVARMRVYESPLTVRQLAQRAAVGIVGKLPADDAPALLAAIEQHVQELHKALSNLAQRHTITLDLDSLELRIDDQLQTTNAESVKQAIDRLRDYARSEDGSLPGSVEVRFAYSMDGVRVRRSNWVADNHVRATAELDGALPTIDYARLQVDVEALPGAGTRFTMIAAVHAPIGRHPNGPITRFVERVMAQLVDEELARVESQFRAVVEAPQQDAAQLLVRLIEAFRNGIRN